MTARSKAKTSDMLPADIKHALAQKGKSYADVDRQFGLPESTASNSAKKSQSPAGEVAIAAVLGIKPSKIWPSRYDRNGKRLIPQPSANYTPKPALRKPENHEAA